MDYTVRKACESDRLSIVKTLAYSFEKVLSPLSKDMERFVSIFERGVETERFYVAEQNDELIGIIACTDCKTGRALKATKKDCIKHLGLIRGNVAYKFLWSDLMRPLTYPETTGHIDVVGVLQHARGKGVAKAMLEAIVKNHPQYTDFILEVESTNAPAVKRYSSFGFVEFKRERPVKFIKRYSVLMRYTVQGRS